MRFADRHDAGRRLGQRLLPFADDDPVVLALPRGGVPVAFEVASTLHAPLDVLVVRKLGVPFQPELAMGAIGEDGVRVVNELVVRETGVSAAELAATERTQRAELETRCTRLRGERGPLTIAGRTVVIVDDGIATGSTARVACRVARARGAQRIVLAVPVAPRGVPARLLDDADDVICLDTPLAFHAVGQFYDDFRQVSDADVAALIARAGAAALAASIARIDEAPIDDRQVQIPVGPVLLPGMLTVPDRARAVVLFAHGSGSSRHSPRNRSVAAALNAAGFATLLFDLLAIDEERDRRHVFDIALLSARLRVATDWIRRQPETQGLPVCYFGASTGAAAALAAAADAAGAIDPAKTAIAAVVSRGGRPDLAADQLGLVRAPTLLIVGGRDREVLDLNRAAARRLRCPNRLEVVPDATHLFEEQGALARVARLAIGWFDTHLGAVAPPAGVAAQRPLT
jgi:predicted phosphoribosyltransferase/alpha-beta hydrolase superfamily lysophospholipase